MALHTRQRQIVRAQLGTGRQLAAIIDQADESRLAAIVDGLDDDPAVLASSAPECVAAEVRERVFARLVALGAEDAVTAAAQVRESQAATAWHAALTELHSTSGLSYPTRAALHDADPRRGRRPHRSRERRALGPADGAHPSSHRGSLT
ncbi:MAG: hypothetical protein ACRDT7_06010 [Microbacterium sp.]